MRSTACGTCRCRRGGMTPLAVLTLALLIGVVAIVVDGGSLMEQRRHVQAAADAAALAAASDLLANYSTNHGLDLSNTAKSSALSVAAANGFSNDGDASIVTINFTPKLYQGGANVGKSIPPGYVEVIIQCDAGRMFSNVFGSGAVPVRARAVARGQWAPSSNALTSLSLTASPALQSFGDASLTFNGGVQVNSGMGGAINLGHNGMTAGSVNLNTAAGISPSSLLPSLLGVAGSTPAVTSSAPVPDPLRNLAPPDPSLLQAQSVSKKKGGVTNLYPGIYQNTIKVSGTVYLHTNSDGTPGIYYLEKGFDIKNATVTTAPGETGGVMLYNEWQNQANSIKVTTNGSLSLIPPASGPYQGIIIFQKRGTPGSVSTVPPLVVNANGRLSVTGTVYAPYTSVSMLGTSSLSAGQLIVDSVSVGGDASLSVNPANLAIGDQPIANTRAYGLVE